jgi:uncharacterized membrane protein YeaQ/YmgE (transglycosylase-associated protein family)
MEIVSLIISLISGAVGGNLAGAAMSEKNLGIIGNTIAGLIGGPVGDFIMKAVGVLAATGVATGTAAATGTTGHELDIGSILANIGVSGVSGGALTAVIALIKDAVSKK